MLGNRASTVQNAIENLAYVVNTVGCEHGCSHCSMGAPAAENEVVDLDQMAPILAGLEQQREDLGILPKRTEIGIHHTNDPGLDPQMLKFAQMVKKATGRRVRISTSGYNAQDPDLNNMHRLVVEQERRGAGIFGEFRLSVVSTHPRMMDPRHSEGYERDLANILSIYRPRLEGKFDEPMGFNDIQSGVRQFGIALRHRPGIQPVHFAQEGDHYRLNDDEVIADSNSPWIERPHGQMHLLRPNSRNFQAIMKYNLGLLFPNIPFELLAFTSNPEDPIGDMNAMHLLHNTQTGRTLQTDHRRYLTDAREKYVALHNIGQNGREATFDDVQAVIDVLRKRQNGLEHNYDHSLRMAESINRIIRQAELTAKFFFDPKFIHDTPLSNQGLANLWWRHVSVPPWVPTNGFEFETQLMYANGWDAFGVMPHQGNPVLMKEDRLTHAYQPRTDLSQISEDWARLGRRRNAKR